MRPDAPLRSPRSRAGGPPDPSRRRFLATTGATAALGATAVASSRGAQAAAPLPQRHLVVVFCRGGYDGLTLVPPVHDPAYHQQRPTIAVTPGAARPLGGPAARSDWALHPAAPRLAEFYSQGRMAIVNACGVANPSRSHFDAQAYLEAGFPDIRTSPTGWAGRWLQATAAAGDHPLRSVAIGGAVPASMRGATVVAATGFGSLSLFDWGPPAPAFAASTDDLYLRSDTHPALQQWAAPTLDTMGEIASLGSTARPSSFPDSPAGNGLWPIARLIEAGLPVEIAHVDVGGWDTHERMGAATDPNGRMNRLVAGLDTAIGAFFDRLGPRAADVTMAVVTEFGRTSRENSSGGTDHGRAWPMLVLGGGVNAGVHGNWLGLSPASTDQGDVRVTTDYRTVLAEVLSHRLGATGSHLAAVFPDFAAGSGWLGVTRP